MTGARAYLDWNATTPLSRQARAALIAGLDQPGNPSSVHAEGRAAKALVEGARRRFAALFSGEPIFCGSATEAINLVIRGRRWNRVFASEVEHEAILAASAGQAARRLPVDADGVLRPDAVAAALAEGAEGALVCLPAASGETGVIQPHLGELARLAHDAGALVVTDAVQIFGKAPYDWPQDAPDFTVYSAHKFGGPAGVGVLIARPCHADLPPLIVGGGQEGGRRSGTEAAALLSAAAAAAEATHETAPLTRMAELRNILDAALEDAAPDLLIMGKTANRLVNTTCFALPGWAGETQVMQMDLAGFAVSAGSACSSGKVERVSRALRAMGHDETTAGSALRVSLGPTTTEAEVMAFADAWIAAYQRRKTRAA